MSSQYPVIDLEENEEYPVIDLEEAPSRKKKPYLIHEQPYKTLPRLGMQGQIGSLGLITGGPELGLQAVENLSRGPTDQENIVSQKISPIREFVQGMPEAPYKQMGFETDPQTYAEEIARKIPGIFALVASAPTLLSSIGKGIMSYMPPIKRGAETVGKAGRQVGESFKESFLPSGLTAEEEAFKRGAIQEIPEQPLPPTRYPSQKEALKVLQQEEPTIYQKYSPKEQAISEKPLKGRVKPSEEKLEVVFPEIKPTQEKVSTSDKGKIEQEVGATISKSSFPNENTGGRIQHQLLKNDIEKRKAQFGELYDLSDNEALGASGPQAELAERIKPVLARMESTKDPTTAEQSVINSLKKLLSSLQDPEGAYYDVSAQDLIRTAKSWSSKVKHEDLYGDVKKYLTNLIPDINKSAIETMTAAGKNPKYLQEADRLFKKYAELYLNDEISPFLQKEIANPEQLYRSVLKDEGKYRALKKALDEIPHGDDIARITAKDIVTLRMEKYIDNVELVGSPDYEKDIANLGPIIGDKEAAAVNKKFLQLKKQLPPKPRKIKAKPIEKVASKWLEKDPEELGKLMSTRSGIEKVREEMTKKPGGKQAFDQLQRAEIKNDIQKGKIDDNSTGKDIYEVFNQEGPYNRLAAYIGDEEAATFLKAARELKNERLKRELYLNYAKKGIEKVALYKAIKLLWPLFIH